MREIEAVPSALSIVHSQQIVKLVLSGCRLEESTTAPFERQSKWAVSRPPAYWAFWVAEVSGAERVADPEIFASHTSRTVPNPV
ncbi:hypothetical protein EYF80_029423 [Liparis tanakae]|uniref:Uncharacterized protein n=1 Tax=Liparis tanakae TaxID=230148 RepID=A0A4Z2H651_9TELE|nr:hypothetical protein EYF80_029423 [Liparis tanakae]